VLNPVASSSEGSASGAATGPLVVIVENHAVVAASLASVLRAWGWEPYALTLADQDGRGVLEEAGRILRQSESTMCGEAVAVVDLNLSALMDGVGLIAPLRLLGYRVVVLSGVTDRLRLAEALEQGASALLNKAAPMEELAAVLAALRRGEQALHPERRAELLLELQQARAQREPVLQALDLLTPAEAEVLDELCRGLLAGEIALRHVVSLATVRSQIHSVLLKLGVHSQREAIRFAMSARWSAEVHRQRRSSPRSNRR
jgi:two-component system nitrate/nitrite response regulator NarL